MLRTMGLRSVDDLFADIPAAVRIPKLDLPDGLPEDVVMDLIHIAQVAAESGQRSVLSGGRDDVVPVQRGTAQGRHGKHHVAQRNPEAPRYALHALQHELILGRGFGEFDAFDHGDPSVLYEHLGKCVVLAHDPETPMLHVQGGGAARDAVRHGARDALAPVTGYRRCGKPLDDAAVHPGGARQHEQVHVVSEVGIVLKRLGKQERDVARLASPADPLHKRERGLNAPAFAGDGCSEPLGDCDRPRRQPFRGAHEHTIGSCHAQENVPVERTEPVRHGVRAQQEAEHPGCIARFSLGHAHGGHLKRVRGARGVRRGQRRNGLSDSALGVRHRVAHAACVAVLQQLRSERLRRTLRRWLSVSHSCLSPYWW